MDEEIKIAQQWKSTASQTFYQIATFTNCGTKGECFKSVRRLSLNFFTVY